MVYLLVPTKHQMMAKEIEKYILNGEFTDNSFNIKENFEDHGRYLGDDKVLVYETPTYINDTELVNYVENNEIKQLEISTAVNKIKVESSEIHNIVTNDNVKMKYEICDADQIKMEFDDKPLFCDHCLEVYQNYCTKCDMLTHILNGIPQSVADDRGLEEIPTDILEIRESSGRIGIFALKVIPKYVKFGPFCGLRPSESPLRLKGGKFLMSEDKSKLNWMQHINPAMDIFQQNLLPFQCDGNLYYHSNRQILEDEELLVYFGEAYEDSVNKDTIMDFIPPIKDDVRDVFACTFCYLGFSLKEYLTKHKSNCIRSHIEANGNFSIEELTQCQFCKIYLSEKEYEFHKDYCCERNVRKFIPLTLDCEMVAEQKSRRLEVHKPPGCKFETMYEANLEDHANQSYNEKVYRCGTCGRRFMSMESLNMHVANIHIDGEDRKNRKYSTTDYLKTADSQDKVKTCPQCEFQTKYNSCLEAHVKTKHLKEFNYKCETCDYKTNNKWHLEVHVKSKHLKEFNYKCEMCNYRTNIKCNLNDHVKSKHLKEFSYMCASCGYKTNYRSNLEQHIKKKHLKEFSYECETCDYKANIKANFERHMKTKHLKEFDYKCEICEYSTNNRSNLEMHLKSKHLREFNYKCQSCGFRTNRKDDLKNHVNTKHLKEFSYECAPCGFKTNNKLYLEMHIKTKHLKEFDYNCETCDYKTNKKANLGRHTRAVHLKEFCGAGDEPDMIDKDGPKDRIEEFSYKCELCDYKTQRRHKLKNHIKTKHLKEFDHKCAMCEYETNEKQNLRMHIKSKHLKEYSYKCEACDYRTNRRGDLKNHHKTKHPKEFS